VSDPSYPSLTAAVGYYNMLEALRILPAVLKELEHDLIQLHAIA